MPKRGIRALRGIDPYNENRPSWSSFRTLRPFLALLALILCSVFLLSMLAATGGRVVMPLDDAYIHQQYARQIARGQFFRYNDADPPTSGMTSLLYPFLLAGGYLVGFRGETLGVFAITAGAVGLTLSAWLMSELGSELARLWSPGGSSFVSPSIVSLGTSVLFLTNGTVLWGYLNGMETGLFITVMLAALLTLARGRLRWACVLAALMPLIRPEGAVLSVAVTAVLAARRVMSWRIGEDSLDRWSWALLLPLFSVAIQPLLNLLITGSAMSSGLQSKSWLYNVPFYPDDIFRLILGFYGRAWMTAFTGVHWGQLQAAVRHQSLHLHKWGYMPPGLMVVGVVYLLKRSIGEWRARQPWLATVILTTLAVGLLAVSTLETAFWHVNRYQVPFYALGTLAGGLAVADLGPLLLRRQARPGAGYVLLLACFVVLSAMSVPTLTRRYAQAAHTVAFQQIEMGRWIARSLPVDARVGVCDAGAVRYFGQRATYDLVGLTTQGTSVASRNGSGCTFEAMEHAPDRPDYFAVYDDIYTSPYFLDTDLFAEELFRAEVHDLSGVGSASDHQCVYRADWRLADSGYRCYQLDVLQKATGLVLVDALDVADLSDEQAHRYRWWQAVKKGGFPSEVRQFHYRTVPEREVLDGGRLLTGGEELTIQTRPQQDLLIAGRFHAQSDVYLNVYVNSQWVGEWTYAKMPGQWQESTFIVPGTMIAGEQTNVRFEVQSQRAGFQFHAPYYYWFYQGQAQRQSVDVLHRLDAPFDDSIRLLGYALDETTITPGGAIHLTLFWQATGEVQGDYTVFAHLADAHEQIWGQRDGQPYYGLRPTRLWHTGDVLADPLHVDVRADTPPGGYALYIGLYEATTGQRLHVRGGDAAQRLKLVTIVVE
jgi:hypothetical protein